MDGRMVAITLIGTGDEGSTNNGAGALTRQDHEDLNLSVSI